MPVVIPIAIQAGRMVAKRYVKRKLVRVAAERQLYQRAGMGKLYDAYKMLHPAPGLKKEAAEWAVGVGLAVVTTAQVVGVSVALAPHLHPSSKRHLVGPHRGLDPMLLVA